MIQLILGGSGSGKSSYGESLLSLYNGKKYYIATMKVYDVEGEKKVERHRQMRHGKGFITIEKPENLQEITGDLQGMALLECVSNLVANEMFQEEVKGVDEVVHKVCRDIKAVGEKFSGLIIISNNIFEDGVNYDASSKDYIKALGKVNQFLASLACEVTEVVVGIPVKIK